MVYKEISPGIFMDNQMKIHYKLSRCPCCGGEDTMSHVKYTEMCIECGKQYNLYAVRRSQRVKCTLKNKAAIAHLQVIEDFLAKREAGLVVPGSLDEEELSTRAIVENARALDLAYARLMPAQERPVDVICAHCGSREVDVAIKRPPRQSKLYLCAECGSTYARYRCLTGQVEVLTIEECDELADIMRHYIELNDTGVRVPYFSKYIRPLQTRATSLGGEMYILYGYSKRRNG